MDTARQKAFIETRSMRARRPGSFSDQRTPAGAAIQVFISRVDAFMGTEMFGADIPITIGRHHGAGLQLDDDTVSRMHCRLFLEGGSVFIEDLGSANGTLLNRCRIERRVEITPSDAVHIGVYTLKVRPLIPVALRARHILARGEVPSA